MSRLYAPVDSHNFNQGEIVFVHGVALCNDADVVAKYVAAGYHSESGTELTALDVMPESELDALIDLLGLSRDGLTEKYEKIAVLEAYLPEVDTVRVATPVATPGAGAVADNTEVTLTSATPGVTMYYTTNGDTPTTASTEYTAPIVISDPLTLKVLAVKADMIDSEILSAAYTIAV